MASVPANPDPGGRVNIPSERALTSLAVSLAGGAALTPAERALCRALPSPDTKLVAHIRDQVVAGCDPLGEAFCTLRSPLYRRASGATYTPLAIVASMTGWAVSQGSPVRVVDPGAGSGRFLLATGKLFPKATLIGVEFDPLAALIMRANVAVHGFTDIALSPRQRCEGKLCSSVNRLTFVIMTSGQNGRLGSPQARPASASKLAS